MAQNKKKRTDKNKEEKQIKFLYGPLMWSQDEAVLSRRARKTFRWTLEEDVENVNYKTQTRNCQLSQCCHE